MAVDSLELGRKINAISVGFRNRHRLAGAAKEAITCNIDIWAVRRRLAHRFPYAILCTIKPEGGRILAIMNLKRRPLYWVGRC